MRKKCDLSDFECGMIAGVRQAGHNISETADLLEFAHTTILRVLQRKVRRRDMC